MSTCRYSENLFPAMECLITLYSVMGRPVGFTVIQKCMDVWYGKAHPEQVRRGLDSAHCLGYLKIVEGKYGNKYIPTAEGVVHTAIYTALRTMIGNVPPRTLLHLIECVRTSLVLALLPQLIQGTPDHTLFKASLELYESVGSELGLQLGLLNMRGIMFMYYVALKMLAGIEVRHLKPIYYVLAKVFISVETKMRIMNQWPPLLRPGLMRLFIDTCRNSVTRVSAIMR